MIISFDNSFARLPAQMFARVLPTPVAAPGLIAVNAPLASLLGVDADALAAPAGVAMLAGNRVPDGADPIATAYAGHQFGHWNPQLGDGRAILWGEVVGADGQRRDIQLKGAGRTPWSRGGDGRAWLGPVLREYLLSESMAALGVPTTRALAAVTTGETVWRDEGPLSGAILARVAASHIRVGTFQFFAARGDTAALSALTDHVIARHYPGASGPADLLARVLAAQAQLVARWMGLGFIHGVMNTDNCAISAETIDYGPCAFLDGYHPDMVFSSIDRGGRYAYGAQPQIVLWNLAQFATTLIPLMGDRDAAIAVLTGVLDAFPTLYQAEWDAVFAAKLGLPPGPLARQLADDLLNLMATGGSDFTRTFTALTQGDARDALADRAAFADWSARWQAHAPDHALMARTNPRIIPRNHLVQQVIDAGVAQDFAPFQAMLAAVTRPFDADPFYETAPLDDERITRTFCGT